MSQSNTTVIPVEPEPIAKIEKSVLLIGKFGPTDEIAGEPICLSGNYTSTVLKRNWEKFGFANDFNIPFPNFKSGMQLLTNTEDFVDPLNQLRFLKTLATNIRKDDKKARQIEKMMAPIGEVLQRLEAEANVSPPEEPNNDDEIEDSGFDDSGNENFPQLRLSASSTGSQSQTQVALMEQDALQLDRLSAILRAFVSPIDPSFQLQVYQKQFDLLQKAFDCKDGEGKITAAQVVDKINELSNEIQLENQQRKAAILKEMKPYIPALVNLEIFQDQLEGTTPEVYLMNTKDFRILALQNRSSIFDAIEEMESIYTDVCMMNAIPKLETARAFGDELTDDQFACFWVGLEDSSSLDVMCETMDDNKVTTNIKGAKVFLYGGEVLSAKTWNYSGLTSVAACGRRLYLDHKGELSATGIAESSSAGMFKNNLRITGFSTKKWSKKATKEICKVTGINYLKRWRNQVVTSYYGKTQSGFSGFDQIDPIRTATIVAGNIVTFLNENLGNQVHIQTVVRSVTDAALRNYAGDFKSVYGSDFKCDITYQKDGADSTICNVNVSLKGVPLIDTIRVHLGQ